MPRKPKNEPMTPDEMIEAGKQKRNSKIYRAESMELNSEAISESVTKALNQVKQNANRQKIDLEDYATVKLLTEQYFESCAVTATFPSMSSLAMSMGFTREAVYSFMRKRSGTDSAKFLTQVHDLMGDVLTENSLKGNSNAIASIFILKSMFG